MKTSGSRERPSAMHLLVAFDSFTPGSYSCIALGYSREPPAVTFYGRMGDETNIARSSGDAAKRLPARRREQIRFNPFEDEHESPPGLHRKSAVNRERYSRNEARVGGG
jgi:hypothetical protein